MRRRRSEDDVVLVEMVEAEPSGTAGPDGAGTDRAHPDPARRRRLRWTGIGVLAALAVAVVVVGVVADRREAARRLALAQVEGILEPFDGPLAEAWRAPGGWPLIVSDDLLVLHGVGTNPPLTASDPSSGAILWHREGALGESCAPLGGDAEAQPPTPPDRIVCAQTTDVYLPDDVAVGSLVVLDAAGGSELRSVRLGAPVLFVQTTDDDVILTSVNAGSRLEVRRWDPTTDRDVWTYLSEPALPETLADSGLWGYSITDGVYRLSGEVAVSIDVGTGERVSSAPEPRPTITWPLPDGGTIELTLPGSRSPYAARVLDADGSVRFETEATPWVPEMTDGSVPGILAFRDPLTHDVTGLDATTGEHRWTVDGIVGVEPMLQIDGVAVGMGSGTAVGLDMSDGTRLWEADVGSSYGWPPLTDGDVVILLTLSDAATHLAALDLRTGELVWRVRAPAMVRDAWALGRELVLVRTETEVIVYR